MSYRERANHNVDAIRVIGCEVTIHVPDEKDVVAKSGDWLITDSERKMHVMSAEDFQRYYEVIPNA